MRDPSPPYVIPSFRGYYYPPSPRLYRTRTHGTTRAYAPLYLHFPYTRTYHAPLISPNIQQQPYQRMATGTAQPQNCICSIFRQITATEPSSSPRQQADQNRQNQQNAYAERKEGDPPDHGNRPDSRPESRAEPSRTKHRSREQETRRRNGEMRQVPSHDGHAGGCGTVKQQSTTIKTVPHTSGQNCLNRTPKTL